MGTKILNSRWFYVVLSILLAFLLWVYVGNDPNSVDTGTLRNVRVVFSGLEKLEERGLMISEGAEQTVNLQLSALEIGYDDGKKGLDGNSCAVMVSIDKQMI